MKKGITPIISIIILLLITIALAGVAYTFLLNQINVQTAGSFNIPVGGAFCTASGTDNVITVQVANTGSATLADSDFIIATVDGTDVISDLQTVSISPGQADQVLLNYDCGNTGTGGCATGPRSLSLGTQSLVEHLTIYCP